MHVINIHKAGKQFSEFVDAIMKGEEVMLMRAGKPLARFIIKKPRRAGVLKGSIKISPDFDAPLTLEK